MVVTYSKSAREKQAFGLSSLSLIFLPRHKERERERESILVEFPLILRYLILTNQF